MRKCAVELNKKVNIQCKKCSRVERDRCQESGLCFEAVSVLDGLPVRCVGDWAQEKIYMLVQYFGIFVQGMKNKWSGKLNYVEICSGPGRCVLREKGDEIDGTALAIARHPCFPILNQAFFVDYNSEVLNVLDRRLTNFGVDRGKAKTIIGDFTNNLQLNSVLENLPKRHLNLVFIDPTECNIPFRTVKLIASTLQSADIIINVAVGTDANRNLVNAITDHRFTIAKQKYTDFLGSDSFFQDIEIHRLAERGRNQALRQRFVAAYIHQLGELGFIYTDMKAVRSYYSLLFASRHKRGLDFWRKANKIDPHGQRTLWD